MTDTELAAAARAVLALIDGGQLRVADDELDVDRAVGELRDVLPVVYRCRDCRQVFDKGFFHTFNATSPQHSDAYRQSCPCGSSGQWRQSPEAAMKSAAGAESKS